MKYRIVFLGAGNLAVRLSLALKSAHFNVVQVFNRSENPAKELAKQLGAEFTTSPSGVINDADIYMLALADSAWDDVLPKVDFKNNLIVHSSGSMPLDALRPYSENIGVLYPLQTFSKQRRVSFYEIPVFVEANSARNEEMLFRIGQEISQSVSHMDSEKRLFLHIAAVFSCNFVNHCYALGEELLNSKDIPFDVLKPLIDETAKKVMEMSPHKAQTGPAVRFDENIIEKHLEALRDFPIARELYNSISKSIFDHHQNKK